MRQATPGAIHLLLAVCAVGCGSYESGVPVNPSYPLLVTAGTTVLAPVSPNPIVDAGEFWPYSVTPVVASYELTTPPNEEFAFGISTWATSVDIQHLRDGDMPVAADGLSLARAGMLPLGNALRWSFGSCTALGDLPGPLTIQGRIERDQVFGLVRSGSYGTQAVILRLRIGPPSAINRAAGAAVPASGMGDLGTLYSSDSTHFGLPAVAVAGARTTVVCDDGDRPAGDPRRRYELRLQRDAQTGEVVGGGSVEPPLGFGGARDHDVIARDNVLAFLRAESQGVRVRLSFDGGATLGSQELLVLGTTRTRLVQAAFGPDWRVAVVCWRESAAGGGLELVVVEGQPAAFDGAGLPSWFVFWQTDVLFSVPSTGAVPVPPSIAWSTAGDLVIGYGVNGNRADAGEPWASEALLRCAVRSGGGQWVDREVDRLPILAHGPSVAVTGDGRALRILYGHEADDGVRIVTSDDAGATFVLGATVGAPGDREPSLFVRGSGGQTRVDVLYLAPRADGVELHRSTWLDWPVGEHADTALTTARRAVVPAGPPFPSGMPTVPFGFRVTQVHGQGYDAVRDGDDLVVVYDEVTSHSALVCWSMTTIPSWLANPGWPQPPPLATGLTLPMPAPDPAHAHQLRVLRLP